MANLLRETANLNLEINKGSDFSATFTFPYDLSSYSATAELRASRFGANVDYFTVSISSADLTISLTDTETGALTAEEYFWLLETTLQIQSLPK